MSPSGTRTDRGHVVLSTAEDGTYQVEICEGISPDGHAMNVFAKHTGVEGVVTQIRGGFREIGETQFTAEPAEVFVDANTGQLCVSDITRGI